MTIDGVPEGTAARRRGPRGHTVDVTAVDVTAATMTAVDGTAVDGTAPPAEERALDGTSPIVIRTKDHEARPMSLEQALYEMELVGHDFYLFVDADSGRPSVVYRRRGWSYGVIRLNAHALPQPSPGTPAGEQNGTRVSQSSSV